MFDESDSLSALVELLILFLGFLDLAVHNKNYIHRSRLIPVI